MSIVGNLVGRSHPIGDVLSQVGGQMEEWSGKSAFREAFHQVGDLAEKIVKRPMITETKTGPGVAAAYVKHQTSQHMINQTASQGSQMGQPLLTNPI